MRPPSRLIGRLGLTIGFALAAGAGPAVGSAPAAATGAFTWSVSHPLDTSFPFAQSTLAEVACAPGICLAASNLDETGPLDLWAADDPTHAWARAGLSAPQRAGLPQHPTCASAHLCAALEGGLVLASTTPSSGPWSTVAEPASLLSCSPECAGPDLTAIDCPTEALCVVGTNDGRLLALADPATPLADGTGSWGVPAAPTTSAIRSISCASSSLCVAVDAAGEAVTSTTPASGGWRAAMVAPSGGLISVSCPSATLCVAKDAFADVFTTSDPASGRWRHSTLQGGVNLGGGVSCTSRPLCVAVAGTSAAWVATDAGMRTWRRLAVDPSGQGLFGITCGLASGCTATGRSGRAFHSPAPPGADWTAVGVAGSSPITGLACAAAHLCLGIDPTGHVLGLAPGGSGVRARVVADDAGRMLSAVTCHGVALCAATDAAGGVLVSPDPAGAGRWTRTVIDPGVALRDIACPGASACVAVDARGYVLSSTDPAAARPRWRRFRLTGTLARISCPTERLCLTTAGDGAVWSTSTPRLGARAWKRRVLDPKGTIDDIQCPAARLCVAFDLNGFTPDLRAFASTDPLAGRWRQAGLTSYREGAESFARLACPSTSLCLGLDEEGVLYATAHPADPRSWSPTNLVDAPVRNDQSTPANPIPVALKSVACAGPRLCLVGDAAGAVVVGRR